MHEAAPVTTPADHGDEPGTALLRLAFARSSAPQLITDAAGRICHANPAFEQASGYCILELRGQTTAQLHPRLPGPPSRHAIWRSLRRQQRWQGEVWSRHKDGQLRREWLAISALPEADGRIGHYLAVYAGMAEQLQGQLPVGAPEGVDPTTGVLNRAAFIAATQRLHKQQGPLVLINLDIERFTELNEQLGLAAGDALLRRVAMRCTQVGRDGHGECLVGRVGPDEFALAWVPRAWEAMQARSWEPAAVLALVERLQQEVQACHPAGEGGRTPTLGVSLGVAHMPSDASNAAEALLHAAAARQDARSGQLPMQSYAAHEAQRQLARALRAAIEADQIELALQPKVSLNGGGLCGLEALARWTTADGQVVPPSRFIALAEQRGMIAELGDRVLERVLVLLADWQRAGHALVPVAVNFSAQQFHRRDAAERIRQALRRHGIAPALLELELTESVLLGDAETALHTLAQLRELGVKVAIDDFGTGYSSLAYLRRFSVDSLKIDQSFVREMCADERTSEIVRTIVQLAHRLELRCVAEGVETGAQLARLRELGCDEAQGYLLARPMPCAMLTELLALPVPWMPLFALL